MIAKWLRRKLGIKAAKAAREDIERFILGLKGGSDEELGFVVAQATVFRLMFRDKNLFPDSALGVGPPLPNDERLQVQTFLGEMVSQFQSESGGEAATGATSFALGTMVWLHSMRAVTYPEIRVLGREMWQQLERGFPYASEAFEGFESPSGAPPPKDIEKNFRFVPPGLEPTR